MPQLGKTKTRRFSRTKAGRDRGWLHGAIYTRPLWGWGSLEVITRADHPKDQRLVGEIVGRVEKEKHAVYSPQTLTTFLRGAHHIRRSDTDAVERGHAQVVLLEQSIDMMRRWPNRQASIVSLLSLQLALLGERLLRAETALRLAAGERVDGYSQFLDSLGRPNPLISTGQMRIAARDIAAQVGKDERHVLTALGRIELATSLWSDVNREVSAFLALPTDLPQPELIAAMEGLQIKPFSFAVSRTLEYRRYTAVRPVLAEVARRALRAEQALAMVDFTLSAIKHHPQDFDRRVLGKLQPADMAGFEDELYKLLLDEIAVSYEAMVAAFRQMDYPRISRLAGQLQSKLRYRQGPSWNQPHFCRYESVLDP